MPSETKFTPGPWTCDGGSYLPIIAIRDGKPCQIGMPDGHGGKHRLELIVARPAVADAIEEIAAMQFNVTNINAETGGRKQ